jgi:methionine-rich copper-binding protein CopC
MLKALTATVAVIGLLSASPVFAHAALKVSAPASGATVAAPHDLNLTFSEKVHLTAIKLTAGGKDVPGVTVAHGEPAATFAVPLPHLAPAKYDVRWSAIGDDGHPVNGTFTFTVSNSAS